jgi:copper chaperone NosL
MARVLLSLLVALAMAACGDKEKKAPPPPQSLTLDAMGHYCGMNVLEHSGPKGQILLSSRIDPVWFSSARDAFAFTMMPEEPKDILAVYVSDMGKATSWEEPGADNWVEARKAFFVIGSAQRGGMGVAETVPFSDRAAAERFATEHGGRVVGFTDVPRDYVLSSATDEKEPAGPPTAAHAH